MKIHMCIHMYAVYMYTYIYMLFKVVHKHMYMPSLPSSLWMRLGWGESFFNMPLYHFNFLQ